MPFRRESGCKSRLKTASLVAILLVVLLAAGSLSVEAVVIGANKGVVNLDNVMKNGYAQEFVTFTTDTDFNLSVTYTVRGDIKDWVHIEPGTNPFYTSRTTPYTLAVVVEPPADAKIDKYSGSIEFLTGALASPEGQFGTAVRTAITINLGVMVTGQEVVSCSMEDVVIGDVEENYPIEVYGVTVNRGNVRIQPQVILEFWNQDQSKLVSVLNFTVDDQILPTTQRRFMKSIAHKLPIGQYWVRMKTPLCGDSGSRFLTMSILERGGVSDQGELIAIENQVDAKVGQIVPIDAVFANLGSRVVSAKFKGTITSGGEDNIFKIIDTEPIDVDPGQTERLRTYFNPVQDGKYVITGRVLYNRKLTFEKSSILNVYPGGVVGSAKSILSKPVVALLLLAIVILVVLIIIRRRKKSARF